MARIRTVKPEMFQSYTIKRLSLAARWTFVGLLTHVDDRGRARDDARIIRGAVWPLEDDEISSKDVEGYLDEMSHAGLICRYLHRGVPHLHIVNFAEHQKVNRPTESKLPACPVNHFRSDYDQNSHEVLTEPSVSPQWPDSPIQDPDQPFPDSLSPHGFLSEDSRLEVEKEVEREVEVDMESGAPQKRGRPKRSQTEAPADLDLTAAFIEAAMNEHGFDATRIEREKTRFLGHHRAKGNKFSDWTQAFRNWLIKAKEFDAERAQPATQQQYQGFQNPPQSAYGPPKRGNR